jgi:hypothetical protein
MAAGWMANELEIRHVLSDYQYGFRKHRSAPDVPLRVTQRVFNNRAKKLRTILVGLDVKAAYDSVWHDGLIYKLLRLPLPRNLIGWLVDFLRDRKLQVRVNGHLSQIATVNCGVPQGSPISPLLYIIYTSDLLAESVPNTETEAYADDLTTPAAGATVALAQQAAQAEIDRIAGWAQLWRQQFNASKSETLLFSHVPGHVNLHLNGLPIPQQQFMRVLGVHFDPRLTFQHHVEKVIASCRVNLIWFRRLVSRPGLSSRWRRTVYYALVRSKLSYANPVLSSIAKRHRQRLQVVQNNCLRAILNVRLADWTPTAELHSRCRVPTLASFFAQCRKRYINQAVKHVIPVRDDAELAIFNNAEIRGPMSVLKRHLQLPLPPLAI